MFGTTLASLRMCEREVRDMLRGVMTTKSVLLHPIILFRCFGFSVALKMLIWALDRQEHFFLSRELFS